MINKDIIILSENYKNNTSPPLDGNSSNNNENNNLNTNNEIIDSSTDNSKIENNDDLKQSNKNDISTSWISKNKKSLIIGILSLIVIIMVIVILIIILTPPSHKPEENIEIINENVSTPINHIPINDKILETEFYFKNNVKDLKKVSVEQKYTENILSNGKNSSLTVFRLTNYEYFFLSEEEPDEENIDFYEKKYTVAILINSQCFSINDENCTPKKMIDITKVKKDNINSSLRYVDELPDFKDLPVPLCLFNITVTML